jgi:Ca2+-binding EF-hand superfamily protein
MIDFIKLELQNHKSAPNKEQNIIRIYSTIIYYERNDPTMNDPIMFPLFIETMLMKLKQIIYKKRWLWAFSIFDEMQDIKIKRLRRSVEYKG